MGFLGDETGDPRPRGVPPGVLNELTDRLRLISFTEASVVFRQPFSTRPKRKPKTGRIKTPPIVSNPRDST